MIKKQTIEDYIIKNARSKASFETWYSILYRADWNLPKDIIATFNSADILGKGSNRVVFNIGGNNYRLICRYYFGKTRVHLFVKWIGTHAEYTALCNKGNQYTVQLY
ncbi:MAG: type II toxin-antitoxin system HigB family toxin [Bacteroidales bacterium]|nr:type II toxin-antitoxin system HigB family toxin [Bacteroidales bacterium]